MNKMTQSIEQTPFHVDSLIDELLNREGGYVNDPDDPGGATNFGITIATLSAYRGQGVTPGDVAKLSRAEAVNIYKRNYLTRPKIDRLPAILVPSVFDMYVNAGNNAIKILQNVLNEFSAVFDLPKLAVDGAIGPRTLERAAFLTVEAGQYLVDAYGIARRQYYYALADRRAASRKYARTQTGGKGGWIKRAEEFISERFRLTERQHRARTAAWGV